MEGVGDSVGVQVGVRVGVRGVGETTSMVGEDDEVRVSVPVGDRVGVDLCMFPSARESEKTPMSRKIETRAMMIPQSTCRAVRILFHFFRVEQDR